MNSILDNMIVDGFEWDQGNLLKNLLKHGVTFFEAEEVFYNEPLLFFHDEKHGGTEKRFIAFGKTHQGKFLTVAFTLRTKKGKILIRVISARPMHRKEKLLYEKTISQN